MRIRAVTRGLNDIRNQCHGHPLTLLQLRELVLGVEGIAGVLDHQERPGHQEQRNGDCHHHLDEGVAFLTWFSHGSTYSSYFGRFRAREVLAASTCPSLLTATDFSAHWIWMVQFGGVTVGVQVMVA